MGSIRLLSDNLINQIAAGEVIERPASVIKELVENSIDAQSKQITVEIVKGGLERMTVTDDGLGMDESDARMAFERHATSKIQRLDDLDRIRSLGFRGEALASIASVSKVALTTRVAGALSGVRLEMEGGKNPVVTAFGGPVGTKIEISDLFFNTPARKKFSKSEATEYRHVLETLQDIALAHPELRLKFISNGRTLFDFLGTEEMKARIGGLFGKALSDEMVPVFYGGRDLHVSGYIGKPHTARATRKYQYVIVNGRPIQDTRLTYAVKDAYSNLIPSSQYPIFVLCLSLDPSQVDVNVHPRKLEVRFAQAQEVFRVVRSSVQAALTREGTMTPVPLRDRDLDTPAYLRKASIQPTLQRSVDVEEVGETYDPTPTPTPATGFTSSVPTPSYAPRSSVFGTWGATSTASSTPSVLPSPTAFTTPDTPTASDGDALAARKAYLMQKRAERLAAQGQNQGQPAASIFAPTTPSTPPPATNGPLLPSSLETVSLEFNQERAPHGLRPLTQVNQSYLIAQDDEGLVIVDQHAAHERVMLEKFRAMEAERSAITQPLLTPLQLDLDYREKAILEEHLDTLRALGFDLQPFGGNTYQLEAIPDFVTRDDVDAVLRGFLDDLLNDELPREAARRREHVLHTLACKAATKFGRKLSLLEQEALLRSLHDTEGSCACAHGRPTMMRLEFSELERRFGRKG